MSDIKKDSNFKKEVDAYIKGRLSAQETRALWVKLLKRPEELDRLQTEVDLARLHKPEQVSEPATAYYWKWVAAAAAVVLIMLSISFLFHKSNTNSIQQWALADIDLVKNLASAEINRSGQDMSPADSLLNAAFQAALLGQESNATDIYHQIIDGNYASGTISKAYLNLGILQFNNGAYGSSIDNFRQALTMVQENEWLKGNLYWYLSNAFIYTRQLDEARAAANQAYKMSIIYKQKAFELRARLDYSLGKTTTEQFQRQIKESNN